MAALAEHGTQADTSGDEDLASFMPDFSLMEQRSPTDDEKSVGLASTTGRFNNDTFGTSSAAPTKTCMPGGFFWRSKVCSSSFCLNVFAFICAVET